jgi:hypothetical protein
MDRWMDRWMNKEWTEDLEVFFRLFNFWCFKGDSVKLIIAKRLNYLLKLYR